MPLINTLFSMLFLLLAWHPAQQEEQLQISLKRNWGYSSGTGKIQGTFTLRAAGLDDLEQVVFYLDDQVLGEVNQPPFEVRFTTDEYPLGVHQLLAVGRTAAGKQLTSNLIQVQFVTSQEGWQAAGDIILPIAVILIIAMGVAFLVPLLTRGKREQLPLGAPRQYGHYGGAICPKCSRPFSRHIYGINLLTHKYDRCPYCGKWSLVRRASLQELEAAEAAELETAQAGAFAPTSSADLDLQQEIEDSRFEDL